MGADDIWAKEEGSNRMRLEKGIEKFCGVYIPFVTGYCQDDQINKDELGGAHGTCATEKMCTEFWWVT